MHTELAKHADKQLFESIIKLRRDSCESEEINSPHLWENNVNFSSVTKPSLKKTTPQITPS